MAKRLAILAIGLATGLAACATAPNISAKVDAAVVGLTTAEQLALVYTNLPRCPARAPCSDPAIVQRIKTADNYAYAAVKAAEQNEALLSFALSAIADFRATIPATR